MSGFKRAGYSRQPIQFGSFLTEEQREELKLNTNNTIQNMVLTKEDLSSLLLFTVVTEDWVREVHRFTSQRKRKQSYVLFRNKDNKKLYSLDDLKKELGGASFLDFVEFKTAFSHDIVCNKVGANSKARKCAKSWMAGTGKVDECILEAKLKASGVAPDEPDVEPIEVATMPAYGRAAEDFASEINTLTEARPMVEEHIIEKAQEQVEIETVEMPPPSEEESKALIEETLGKEDENTSTYDEEEPEATLVGEVKVPVEATTSVTKTVTDADNIVDEKISGQVQEAAETPSEAIEITTEVSTVAEEIIESFKILGDAEKEPTSENVVEDSFIKSKPDTPTEILDSVVKEINEVSEEITKEEISTENISEIAHPEIKPETQAIGQDIVEVPKRMQLTKIEDAQIECEEETVKTSSEISETYTEVSKGGGEITESLEAIEDALEKSRSENIVEESVINSQPETQAESADTIDKGIVEEPEKRESIKVEGAHIESEYDIVETPSHIIEKSTEVSKESGEFTESSKVVEDAEEKSASKKAVKESANEVPEEITQEKISIENVSEKSYPEIKPETQAIGEDIVEVLTKVKITKVEGAQIECEEKTVETHPDTFEITTEATKEGEEIIESLEVIEDAEENSTSENAVKESVNETQAETSAEPSGNVENKICQVPEEITQEKSTSDHIIEESCPKNKPETQAKYSGTVEEDLLEDPEEIKCLEIEGAQTKSEEETTVLKEAKNKVTESSKPGTEAIDEVVEMEAASVPLPTDSEDEDISETVKEENLEVSLVEVNGISAKNEQEFVKKKYVEESNEAQKEKESIEDNAKEPAAEVNEADNKMKEYDERIKKNKNCDESSSDLGSFDSTMADSDNDDPVEGEEKNDSAFEEGKTDYITKEKEASSLIKKSETELS